MRSIGEELLYQREKVGMTQKELKSKSRVSLGAISGAENGRTIPGAPVVASIAKVLTALTESEWLEIRQQTINRRGNTMTKTEPEVKELLNRDFSKPVYILGDKTIKKTCDACRGSGKVQAIVNRRKIEAGCAKCDATGGMNSVAKTIYETYITSVVDKIIVKGNIRETVYELQNRTVHNNAVITRTNSKGDLQVFDTRKQAEEILRAYLEEEK